MVVSTPTNQTTAPTLGPGTGGGGSPSWLDSPFMADLATFALFLAILVGGYLVGRTLRAIYTRMVRGRAPTSRQILTGKTIVLVAVVLAAAAALTQVYGADLLQLTTTLGILSIALGFGLQNTIANLAAGVGLSLDKPFDVGDRIQVGQTWGDVESIGLRSTRIITTSGQHVIIPNAILDTREVWNSTLGRSAFLRLEVPVSISYESSLELAEYVMLQAARRNDNILAYPNPVVRARRFAADGVDLELRVWLKRAVQRPVVLDQLVRAIKRGFDEHGVAFPFPQRTVSYLADLPQPSKAPEFLAGEASQKPTVLACTRGPEGARVMGEAIVSFIDKLGARLVVLHVRPRHQTLDEHDAQVAINVFLARANEAKVPAKGRTEIGDLSDTVAIVAREEGAKLIIFGRSRRTGFAGRWLHREIAELEASQAAPVLELDTDRVADDDFVEKWRAELHPAPEDPPQEDQRPQAPEADDEDDEAEPAEKPAEEDRKGGGGDDQDHPDRPGGPHDERPAEDRGPPADPVTGARRGEDKAPDGPGKDDDDAGSDKR